MGRTRITNAATQLIMKRINVRYRNQTICNPKGFSELRLESNATASYDVRYVLEIPFMIDKISPLSSWPIILLQRLRLESLINLNEVKKLIIWLRYSLALCMYLMSSSVRVVDRILFNCTI